MLSWTLLLVTVAAVAALLRLAGGARLAAGVVQVLSWVLLLVVMLALYLTERGRARRAT